MSESTYTTITTITVIAAIAFAVFFIAYIFSKSFTQDEDDNRFYNLYLNQRLRLLLYTAECEKEKNESLNGNKKNEKENVLKTDLKSKINPTESTINQIDPPEKPIVSGDSFPKTDFLLQKDNLELGKSETSLKVYSYDEDTFNPKLVPFSVTEIKIKLYNGKRYFEYSLTSDLK